MAIEGSVYQRLNCLFWHGQRDDEAKEQQRLEASTGERMVLVSGPNSWAASCIHPSGDEGLLAKITQKLVKKAKVNSDDCWLIRDTLLDALKEEIKGVRKSTQDEKIARIGFPLHLRLLLDSQDGGTWEQVGRRVAAQWELSPAAVPSWFWHQMFFSESIRPHEVVSTRTIATTQFGGYGPAEGVSATLSVGQIDWPADIEMPESRFVPHPQSFGFCLDDDFVKSLDSCHCYLKSYLKKEPELWPDNVVLEWNMSMDQPDCVPILEGGSAGAALTLAAGSLLARRYLQKPGSS